MAKNRRTPSRRSSRRGRIAVAALLIAVLAVLLLLAYYAAARRLLSTRLLRSLISTPSTQIDYDEASSPWPGRLRIRNLRIRAEDSNVQWYLRLEDARVVFSLTDLFGKTFHAVRVRGTGLSFRVRQLRKPGRPSPPPLALIPPIPGFAKEPRPTAPPPPGGARPSEWAIRVENVSVEHLDEIWLEIYRSRGSARLTGGFFLVPGREAEVGPAAIDFSSGDVRIGDQPVLVTRLGRIAVRIERHDIRRYSGDLIWRVISGDVDLRGRTSSIGFLDHYLTSPAEPRFSGGAGTLAVRGRIEKGTASGSVRLLARGARFRIPRAGVEADADLSMNVRRWDLEHAALDVSGSSLAVSNLDSPADGTTGWSGRFDFPSGRIDGAVDLQVVAKCRDARPLLTLFGVRLPQLARRPLELENLVASASVTLGPSLARVRDLDATGGSLHVFGEYRERGSREEGVFLIDAGKVNVGLTLSDGKTRIRPIGTRRWLEKERETIFRDAEPKPQRTRSTTTAVP